MAAYHLLLLVIWRFATAYTIIENDGSSWKDAVRTCKKSSDGIMARIQNPKQYREMVRFLQEQDSEKGYFIGIEWKQNRMRNVRGKAIRLKYMPLLKEAKHKRRRKRKRKKHKRRKHKRKRYGIYWQNGQFHKIKRKAKRADFEIVIQDANNYRELRKYDYFLWGFFERTKDPQLLQLERKKIFRYKEFNGARYKSKLNQFQFKGHNWVIEMDTAHMDTLQENIKADGGDADALYVKEAYLTSLKRKNIIKKVAVLIRAVDRRKSILFVNNGEMKHMAFNIMKPINHMSLEHTLSLCQHEYVFNLVKSQRQIVKKKRMKNIDSKLLKHKGLVIFQGLEQYRKYFDEEKYFVIHARNMDRTVAVQKKDHAFKQKMDELPHREKILTPIDLVIPGKHVSQPILWKMVGYNGKHVGTEKEYGLAHLKDPKRNNEMFVFASVHNDPQSTQMIKKTIAETAPDYVFIEIDSKRMAQTCKEQQESDIGVTFDYGANEENNVGKIGLVDHPYEQYTPWMYLRKLLVSDHKLLPSITVAGIYFDVLVNMRNHLMIKSMHNFIALSDIKNAKIWITVGKIHWAKGKDADPIYSVDMKDLMTDAKFYQHLEQPIEIVEYEGHNAEHEKEDITLNFEVYPY